MDWVPSPTRSTLDHDDEPPSEPVQLTADKPPWKPISMKVRLVQSSNTAPLFVALLRIVCSRPAPRTVTCPSCGLVPVPSHRNGPNSPGPTSTSSGDEAEGWRVCQIQPVVRLVSDDMVSKQLSS